MTDLITETVTVKYYNPPKNPKGPASIKDDKGRYLKFWPDKITPPAVGATIVVHYKAGEYNGKPDFTIQKIGEGAPAAPAANPYRDAPPPRDMLAPTIRESDNTAERIFVCGIVNQAVAAGKVEPTSPSEIIACVQAARTAYEQTFGRG